MTRNTGPSGVGNSLTSMSKTKMSSGGALGILSKSEGIVYTPVTGSSASGSIHCSWSGAIGSILVLALYSSLRTDRSTSIDAGTCSFPFFRVSFLGPLPSFAWWVTLLNTLSGSRLLTWMHRVSKLSPCFLVKACRALFLDPGHRFHLHGGSGVNIAGDVADGSDKQVSSMLRVLHDSYVRVDVGLCHQLRLPRYT